MLFVSSVVPLSFKTNIMAFLLYPFGSLLSSLGLLLKTCLMGNDTHSRWHFIQNCTWCIILEASSCLQCEYPIKMSPWKNNCLWQYSLCTFRPSVGFSQYSVKYWLVQIYCQTRQVELFASLQSIAWPVHMPVWNVSFTDIVCRPKWKIQPFQHPQT